MVRINLILMVLLCSGLIVGAAALSLTPPLPSAPVTVDPSQLLRRLGDSDTDVAQAAEAAIRALGSEAIPLLQEGSASDNPRIALRASRLLKELCPVALPPQSPPASPASSDNLE